MAVDQIYRHFSAQKVHFLVYIDQILYRLNLSTNGDHYEEPGNL